jgi:hypothetical protein
MLEKADLRLVRGKTRINSWAASKGANPHTRSIYEKNYLRYSVFFSGIPEINNSAIFSTYKLCDRIFENATS